MPTLLSQDPYKPYTPSFDTEIRWAIERERVRLGQSHPNLDERVQRNRLRAKGFDSAMEQRDAEMRRILDRVEAGEAQPDDILEIRSYMGLF